MYKRLLIIFLINCLSNSFASETHESDKRYCLSKHIKSAIKVNKKRSKKYAALTDGQSKTLSRQLIFGERLSLISGKFFDTWARKYQKHGIPILCKDLMKMDSIPQFTSFSVLPERSFSEIYQPNMKKMTSTIKHLIKSNQREELHYFLKNEIHKLNMNPNYYCTLRHFLESIHRTVNLTGEYERLAAKASLKSPWNGIKRYLKAQTATLKLLSVLDKKAAKFQEEGLAIFCQDLPQIPIPEYN